MLGRIKVNHYIVLRYDICVVCVTKVMPGRQFSSLSYISSLKITMLTK